jgi:Bacteriophage Mu Gam like protein
MIDLEVTGTPDLDDDAQREAWRIHSDREAAWALRKLAAALAETQRIAQAAADEIDALKAWRDAAVAGPQRDAAFFEAALVRYRVELEGRNPELPKTYKLPGGVIARRKQPDQYQVTDEPTFVAWALDTGHEHLLHIEPRTTGLKAFTANDEGTLVTAEGEVVPGAERVVRDDAYSAKPT